MIKWTLEKIENYLKDKEKERGVDSKELLTLSEFVKKHRFESILDLGTFLGVSGYIIGTSSPNLKTLVSIDIAEFEINKHGWNYKDYGKYLPNDAIFIRGDFREKMDPALKTYGCKFAFIDDGHGTIAVSQQITICYNNKVPFIAIHDTNLKKVRRAIRYSISRKMYNIINEILDSDPEGRKGLTFMELIK